MESERIVVIANSRKDGGHCVAGVTLEDPRLVRPVRAIGAGIQGRMFGTTNCGSKELNQVATRAATLQL